MGRGNTDEGREVSSGVGQGNGALPAEARLPQEREVHTWREERREGGGKADRMEVCYRDHKVYIEAAARF